MRHSATFRDFTQAELHMGDMAHPPDLTGYLNLNSTCYWVKHDGCWYRAEGRRAGVRLLQDLEACQNIQEAVALNVVLPAWGELPELSPKAKAARKPPNPVSLLEACSNRVHEDAGRCRPTHVSRHKRGK